jgi:hypothetical protein
LDVLVELFSFRTCVVLLSWTVAACLAVRLWRSRDPLLFKLVLTLVLVVPVIGHLVVYWIANFPSRLHPQSQARHPKRVNTYGPWRTEDDERRGR